MTWNQIYTYLGADVVIRNPNGSPGRQDGRAWADRNRDRFLDRRGTGWAERERYDRLRYPRPAFYSEDYIFVTDRGWRPRWFPYWVPAWAQYWDDLYRYYGGFSNHAYAERMRDQVLRSMAVQQGWR